MTARVECLQSAEALAKLEPEWRAAFREGWSENPFLSWEWAAAWWEHFGAGAEPRILCVRDAASGQLRGLAPLVLRRRPARGPAQLRELSLLGAGSAGADHLGFPTHPEAGPEVQHVLLAGLAGIPRDVLRLEGVASEEPVVAQLLDRAPGAWLRERVCPYLPLPASWQEVAAGLSRNLRYDLRRDARLLERDMSESVTYTTVGDRDELEPALDALFALHQQARVAQGDRGAFARARVRAFHHRIARDFLECGWLRLHLLRVGSRIVAVCYCFRVGHRVSFFQSGYDPSLARYSPGKALVAHAIREAVAEGAAEFDFLRGAHPYKLRFTTRLRRDRRAWVPASGRGRLAIAGYRAGRDLRARWLRARSSR